jgi:hypothetical protein
VTRISTFCVALTALVLSANGASAAVHFISVQPPRIHVPQQPKGHIHIEGFSWDMSQTGVAATGRRRD